MKTHIKHLVCLALLSLIPLIVMGQFHTFQSSFNPVVRSSLVRSINNTTMIVVKNIPYATFSFIDLSIMNERMVPLTSNIIVRDFEILDGKVFFCGDDGMGKSYTGWFEISDLIAGTNSIHITDHNYPSSIAKIESLRKMDVYRIGKEYHIVAVGKAGMSGTQYATIGDIVIDDVTNTVISTVFQIRPDVREYISDVTATNNYVVTINPNYTNTGVHIVKYDIPTTTGSNILAVSTVYNYPMYYNVHVAEFIKDGPLITDMGANYVATLISYKGNSVLLTKFDCSSTTPTLLYTQSIAVSIQSSNPQKLQIKDFVAKPITHSFTILTHDDTCSQVTMIDYSLYGPNNGYYTCFNYLQSIGAVPTYPFEAYIGPDYTNRPFYASYDIGYGSTTCFPPYAVRTENMSMMPDQATVSYINYTQNYTTFTQNITQNKYNFTPVCY